MMTGEFAFSSTGPVTGAGLADGGAVVLATFFGFARAAEGLLTVA